MLTYYITVLILLGFFIYSKLIFYIIFFVSFCPCITYVLCFDIQQEFHSHRRINRIQSNLKEELYDDYRKKNGVTLDCCSICTGEYNEKDYIIALPCDLRYLVDIFRHCFHSACIKKWLENKTVCPLCRIDLRTPNEIEANDRLLNNNNINIVIEGDNQLPNNEEHKEDNINENNNNQNQININRGTENPENQNL